MKMRFLGNTGIKVSPLCFGTMTFGGEGQWENIGKINQELADEMVGLAIESGINFFDTADIYSEGRSEEMLGKALGEKRKEVIVATKCRFQMGNGPNNVGLSRHHIINACEGSLRRLGTDYIDLYQVHLFDPHTPLEETLRALDDLVRQGKVRYIGCSNFSGWQLMKALATSEKMGVEKFVSLQAYYSLVARELEYELVPLAKDQNLAILPWSPLAGGFLTGKFRKDKPEPEGARRSDPKGRFLQFNEEKGHKIVDKLEVIAKDRDVSVAETAINYLLAKPQVTSVIIGARNQEQLKENLQVLEWEMTAKEVERLDEVSKPPRLYPYWMLQSMARRD